MQLKLSKLRGAIRLPLARKECEEHPDSPPKLRGLRLVKQKIPGILRKAFQVDKLILVEEARVEYKQWNSPEKEYGSGKYSFRLVTSEISKKSCPGDGSTNRIYEQLMNEVERTLKARRDADYLDWEMDAKRTASDSELLVDGVHTEAFIQAMKQRTANAQAATAAPCGEEVTMLSSSAGWTKDTEAAARTGVASLIDCVRAVAAGEYLHGFVLARPPSHHVVGNADRSRNGSAKNEPFGFCHLNSIASAVANLRAERPRLRACILDFDVHPGNGNEDTFWNDPDVLTVSVHEHGIWPGENFGRPEYVGGPNAIGSVLNLPLPARSNDSDYYHAFKDYIFPNVRDFAPDIILVAAGFDALKGDPYSNQQLSNYWYGWCVAELMRWDIPMVLNLEGGYNPKHAAQAVNSCVDALAGMPSAMFLPLMAVTAEAGTKLRDHCLEMQTARNAALSALRASPSRMMPSVKDPPTPGPMMIPDTETCFPRDTEKYCISDTEKCFPKYHSPELIFSV